MHINKRIGSFASAALVAAGCAAGMSSAIAVAAMSDLQLSNPVIPRLGIMVFIVLIPLVLFLRFGGVGYAFRRLAASSLLLVGARIYLFAFAAMLLAIALFNPIGGAKIYVFFEEARAVGASYVRESVARALLDISRLRGSGLDAKLFQGNTGQLTTHLLDCTRRQYEDQTRIPPECIDRILELLRGLDPLEQQLVDLRQSGVLAGSTVSVYSPNGYPKKKLEAWPFPADTTRSVWIPINQEAAREFTEPNISSWIAWHDPAVMPSFAFELKLPGTGDLANLLPPKVTIGLFENPNIDCAKKLASAPLRWTPTQEGILGEIPGLHQVPYSGADARTIYEGVYYTEFDLDLRYKISDYSINGESRHLSYSLQLPAGIGDNLCLNFDWQSSSQGVKSVTTNFFQSLPIIGRSLTLVSGNETPSGPALVPFDPRSTRAELTALGGESYATRMLVQRLFQPLNVTPRPGKTQILFELSPGSPKVALVADPAKCRASIACLVLNEFEVAGGEEWILTRGNRWSSAPNRASWIDFRGIPGTSPGVSCDAASYVNLISERDGRCRTVLFENSSGNTVLFLPKLEWLLGQEEVLKNDWRHLIAWSATAAWRSSEKQAATPASSSDRTPAATHNLAFGWSERRGSFIDELISALKGELGWRNVPMTSNSWRSILVSTFLMVVMLSGLLGIIPLLVGRSRH